MHWRYIELHDYLTWTPKDSVLWLILGFGYSFLRQFGDHENDQPRNEEYRRTNSSSG